jgi:hypothetical protein
MTTSNIDIETDIKLPAPYKYEEKVIKKIENLNKKGENILNTFLGFREIETIFYLYLFKKYKSSCFLYNEDVKFRVLGLNINIKTRVSKENEKLYKEHIKVLASVFAECVLRNVKTIIVPITIYDNKDVTHANILVYRKKINQIEHFEPHGNYFMWEEKRSAKIKKPLLKFVSIVNDILKENGKPPISYVASEEVCPTEEGLQSLEAASNLLPTNEIDTEGYCISWNMFFTELCLANPTIESKKLLDIITNYFKDKSNIEDYLRKVIRGYNFFIYEKANKYLEIVLGEKITADKISKLYDDYDNKYIDIEDIRTSLIELIKLETYMITDKGFNLDKELKSIKAELKKKGKKDEIELLMKKKVMENYEHFQHFTPVTTNGTSTEQETTKKTPVSEVIPEKKCPEGKVFNPKTKRCNKVKTNSKTKKNSSSVTFKTI